MYIHFNIMNIIMNIIMWSQLCCAWSAFGSWSVFGLNIFKRHLSICFGKYVLLNSRLQYSHINLYLEHFALVQFTIFVGVVICLHYITVLTSLFITTIIAQRNLTTFITSYALHLVSKNYWNITKQFTKSMMFKCSLIGLVLKLGS